MAIGADSSDFNVLAEKIITRSYIATGLNVGTYYQFKIQAHNNFGLSVYSSTLN